MRFQHGQAGVALQFGQDQQAVVVKKNGVAAHGGL
jgi:hypothetical protein